jgi:hypothetical protein
LSPSTTKKVLVSRFDRESLAGFVNPQTYLAPGGLELLSTTGTIAILPYGEVKFVCFVRDFQQGEPGKEMRLFSSRPKHEGLWIRARFRDGDVMEGVLQNNLLQLEAAGFTFVPPDPGYQYQRLFVPRAALSEISVLGVVGSPLRRKKKGPLKDQIEMFDKG